MSLCNGCDADIAQEWQSHDGFCARCVAIERQMIADEGNDPVMDTYAVTDEVTAYVRRQVYGKGRSQAEAIRGVLLLNPGEWVCGTAFLAAFVPTYAQRISELRGRGWIIWSQPCDHPDHDHRGLVGAYTMPTDARGMTL